MMYTTILCNWFKCELINVVVVVVVVIIVIITALLGHYSPTVDLSCHCWVLYAAKSLHSISFNIGLQFKVANNTQSYFWSILPLLNLNNCNESEKVLSYLENLDRQARK